MYSNWNLLCNILLTGLFLSISVLHLYWAFGGEWALYDTIPTSQEGVPLFIAGFFACFIIGVLFAVLVFVTNLEFLGIGSRLFRPSMWLLIAFVFLARAIGDFNYVGLFKMVKLTTFAQNDELYFTPLCLLLCGLSVWKYFIQRAAVQSRNA